MRDLYRPCPCGPAGPNPEAHLVDAGPATTSRWRAARSSSSALRRPDPAVPRLRP